MKKSEPRKALTSNVIEFIQRLEDFIHQWPRDSKYPMTRIAEATHTEIPKVVEYLTPALSREFEIHDPITFREIERSLANLKQQRRAELEARQQQIQRRKARAQHSFQGLLQKIDKLQRDKRWHPAYKTISYFAGLYIDDLPKDPQLTLCNEALRLGIKAETNFQELAQWLKRGVDLCLEIPDHHAVADALDFIDAYGAHFINNHGDKGKQLILALLCQLNQLATNAGLMYKLKEIYGELALPTPNLGSYYHEL